MAIKSIIQKATRGDQKSIKTVYDMHVLEMFSTSYRITDDVHSSEDIVQESFITSIQKLGTLVDKENYQGWLRRIVINNSLAYLRKKRIFEEVEEGQLIHLDEDHSWYKDIAFENIKMAIQQLPARSRTVFSLHAIEGYKHREIAKMLNISEATSKSQYRYAKQLLRSELTKKYSNEY